MAEYRNGKLACMAWCRRTPGHDGPCVYYSDQELRAQAQMIDEEAALYRGTPPPVVPCKAGQQRAHHYGCPRCKGTGREP